jgi:deoxycytidine triphosphate deaminase
VSILPDWQILRDVKIEPFAEGAVRPGVISYGVSSYGYDVRVGRHFKIFTNVYGAVVDPKKFNPSARRHRTDPVLPRRGRVPDQLRRQEREVPGPERAHPPLRHRR